MLKSIQKQCNHTPKYGVNNCYYFIMQENNCYRHLFENIRLIIYDKNRDQITDLIQNYSSLNVEFNSKYVD